MNPFSILMLAFAAVLLLYAAILWKTKDSLYKHGKQAHFARLGELTEQYVEDIVIEKYDAAVL